MSDAELEDLDPPSADSSDDSDEDLDDDPISSLANGNLFPAKGKLKSLPTQVNDSVDSDFGGKDELGEEEDDDSEDVSSAEDGSSGSGSEEIEGLENLDSKAGIDLPCARVGPPLQRTILSGQDFADLPIWCI